MLTKADRDIKVISYQLSTVISSGEYHQNLHTNYLNEVEIVESTPIYCKIKCKGLLPPLTIGVKTKRGEFKAYLSLNNKTPSEQDHDKTYPSNPKRMMYQLPTMQKQFDDDYVYLTLYSLAGASVVLKPYFQSKKEKREDNSDESPAKMAQRMAFEELEERVLARK